MAAIMILSASGIFLTVRRGKNLSVRQHHRKSGANQVASNTFHPKNDLSIPNKYTCCVVLHSSSAKKNYRRLTLL